MSGICGLYNSDGQPADHNLLERMTGAIAHRGHDRVGHWVHKTVAFGHCMLQTTPESLYESQPLMNDSGGVCLTLDGRVDNRQELIASLESEGARLRDDTDAELVLKAYECWGPQCPLLIIGDFSFAIWDSTRRQLFCARDVAGNRPFVYHWNGRRLIFGSELHALFEDPATPREVNEGMVAEYLAARISNKEETLYKDLLRLPPAHYLIVKNRHITKRRYWDIDFTKEIRYRTDSDYAEHFSEVFRQSVRSCLRSHGPVGAYLSGGLDSSSVVSMIKTIYQRGESEDRGFQTFSMVYPGLPCDESGYIQEMAKRWDLRTNCLVAKEPCFEDLRRQSSFYKDICDYPNGTQADPIRQLARSRGFRVLLTGDYGDERLVGSLYYLADFVRHIKPISLYLEMRKQGISVVSRRGLSNLGHFVLAPVLPDSVRRTVRFTRGMLTPDGRSLAWIENSFAERVHLEQRLRNSMDSSGIVRSSKIWLRMQSEDGGQIHGTEMEDRTSARFGIEQRHPFTDRRMVELSFGLPENQRLRKYQKFVLRSAMRNLLPESICQRPDKAEFSESLFRAVRKASTSSSCRPWCKELGWVNGNRVSTMQKEVQQLHDASDNAYINRVWPLWMILALDLWVDSVLLGRGRGNRLQFAIA
jgi:asparagine synthase (glutamine-hydrolysing)